MWRKKFKDTQDPEIWIDDDVLTDTIRISRHSAIPSVESLAAEINAWCDEAKKAWQILHSQASIRSHLFSFQEKIAAQLLPMMSIQGAWLQGLSAPGVFEDSHQLALMAILADDIGGGAIHATRFDTFRAWLLRTGHHHLTVSYADIAETELTKDNAFRLPALLLSLSRRSDRFNDELIGIDWVFRQIDLMPVLSGLGLEQDTQHALAMNSTFMLGEQTVQPLALTTAIIADFKTHAPERLTRMLRGAIWALENLYLWDQDLREEAEYCLDPLSEAAGVIQRLARAGAVYHQQFRLQGKSLSTWLQDARVDPYPLMAAIAQSKLVAPGKPERSPLVTSLISLKGRMFRVFSDDDVAVLKRWIAGLPDSNMPQRRAIQRVPLTESVALNQPQPQKTHYPSSLRHAYFLLQGRAISGRTRQFADDYIQFWLKNAEHSLRTSQRRLPLAWRNGDLKQWLMAQHDAHGEAFSNSDPGTLPARDEVIHSTLQLAPLTLIDGGWLQGFTDIRLASSTIGFSLFRTYWDELGNGLWELNHPKIYRDVLQQMDIQLPPTGSWEFAFDARLEEASFALPVYWLSIGKFPVRYQAEILGMNLAMELSGVGGGYLSARRFLKHYGFSTAFVDLHNTIDNVQTGHSAWAAEAIEAMMRRTPMHQHEAVWRRVCIGYESLAPRYTTLKRLLKQDRFSFPRNESINQDARHHAYISQPVADNSLLTV
ncbi:iron-containing redox enzyme family protein [Pantoea sp. FN0305]|uniref:iron-containing redox enzyme family protein n=1 Tax=Pantoea sp. FN0305 TaxID=3418559 RepID=UPI003CFB5777